MTDLTIQCSGEYGFAVDGSVTTDANSVTIYESDGRTRVHGYAHSWTTAFAIDGELRWLDAPDDAVVEHVDADGTPLEYGKGEYGTGPFPGSADDDPDSTPTPTPEPTATLPYDPETEHQLAIIGSGDELLSYTITVGEFGTIQHDTTRGTVNDADTIDGRTATGKVLSGTDAYRFTGSLETLDVPAEGVTVELDGDAVDPATLVP